MSFDLCQLRRSAGPSYMVGAVRNCWPSGRLFTRFLKSRGGVADPLRQPLNGRQCTVSQRHTSGIKQLVIPAELDVGAVAA